MEKMKILIVDDDAEIRDSLKVFLGRQGYDAISVENGLIAWNILIKQKFDCLISDIRMPFMDGMDFVHKVRHRCADLAIIMLTGYGSLESAQQAIRIGINDYLTKPVGPEQLKLSIDKCIGVMAAKKKDMAYYYELVKNLEEDKKKLDVLKDDLAGLLNHELGTPISIISESFNLLKEAVIMPKEEKLIVLSEGQKKRLIESFEHGDRWIKNIIEDINYYLDLSRLEGLKKNKMDLIALILSNYEGFSGFLLKEGAALKKDFKENKLWVDIDVDKIINVIFRIMHNSAQHNPEGVEVILRVFSDKLNDESGVDKECAVIEISDNGKGMEEDVIKKFSTIFNVTDIIHHKKGLGLGLVICNKIVELHGGRMKITSQLGKSTSVKIFLPLAKGRNLWLRKKLSRISQQKSDRDYPDKHN